MECFGVLIYILHATCWKKVIGTKEDFQKLFKGNYSTPSEKKIMLDQGGSGKVGDRLCMDSGHVLKT